MKTRRPASHHCSGLTWLEVIVAIVVIGALIALFFPAISTGPRGPSRKSHAATVVKSIVNACKAYHNEYGEFPVIPAARDGSPGNEYYSYGDTGPGGCKIDNAELFNALRAIASGANSGHTLNPRQTRYFDEKKATGAKVLPREGFADGPDFPVAIRGQLFDPWGVQYCIVLEADGDETVNLGAFYGDLAPREMSVRSSAAAFSMSKDGRRGGKNFEGRLRKADSTEGPDDVVSWQ